MSYAESISLGPKDRYFGGMNPQNAFEKGAYLKHLWEFDEDDFPVMDKIGFAELSATGTPNLRRVGTNAVLHRAMYGGSSEYVGGAASGEYHDGTQSWTINLWMKLAALGSGIRGIWTFGTASDKLELKIDASDQLLLFSRESGVEKCNFTSSALSLNTTDWVMYTARFDATASSETYETFVNGVSVASQAEQNTGTAPYDCSADTFYVGRDAAGTFTDAYYAHCAYWISDEADSDQAALTDAQILALYNRYVQYMNT